MLSLPKGRLKEKKIIEYLYLTSIQAKRQIEDCEPGVNRTQ